MRRKRDAALVLATLCAGFIAGVGVQKIYGVGTLLRAARVLPSSSAAATALSSDVVAAEIPADLHGRLSLFVLAGQSNMSGRGDVPALQPTHPRVFVFGNDYRWKAAVEPIDAARGQVDRVSEDWAAGVGPAFSFGRTIADLRPDMALGLIPCARGDSSIDAWQRDHRDSSLYGSCLKRIRAASLEGQVAGLLFFQGEADAYDPKEHPDRALSADRYADRFEAVVSDFRGDLMSPRLPVVFAQIGSHRAPRLFPMWDVIRDQQRAVALPCVGMITTDDLPLRDAVHFTTAGYQEIGQRFAATYLTVAAGCPAS